MPEKTRILFICTNNSARSQIAEGYLRAKYGERFEVSSAGTEPGGVHPLAIAVMEEIGIDISGHRAKSTGEFSGTRFDIVITVCDDGQEQCPFFPGAGMVIHKGFPDPSACGGTGKMIRECFVRVRDEITQWIDARFGLPGNRSHPPS